MRTRTSDGSQDEYEWPGAYPAPQETQGGNGHATRFKPMRIEIVFFGLTVAFVLLALLGCHKPVPSVFNLYDLSGVSLMQCRSQKGGQQGVMQCSAPDGERFQGEWKAMGRKVKATPELFAPPPAGAPREPAAERWSWASTFGVDVESAKGKVGIFLLYGSKGTVIDGVFVFRAGFPGILGAATDNKGHRYKVLG